MIREAETRAKERQSQRRGQVPEETIEQMLDTRETPRTPSIHGEPPLTASEPDFPPEPTRPTTDTSSVGQKNLLERRMRAGRPMASSLNPPWCVDEKNSSAAPTTRRPKPVKEDYRKSQRTCNQIDFPSYSTKEMSVRVFRTCYWIIKCIFLVQFVFFLKQDARPAANGSRHEKCSWMPNMAGDFVASESRRAIRRPFASRMTHEDRGPQASPLSANPRNAVSPKRGENSCFFEVITQRIVNSTSYCNIQCPDK